MNNEWEKAVNEGFSYPKDPLKNAVKIQGHTTPLNNWKTELRTLFQMEDMPTLESFIESLIASQRATWLRSEVEKLEIMLVREYMKGSPAEYQNKIILAIITRYKEELKVLESNQYETT